MATSTSAINSTTTAALKELNSISQLLHLSYHRNKNQHRLAKWWSALSQLKRQVQKLVLELENLETAEKFDVKGKGRGGGEGKYVKAAREKVEVRVEFMERRLVTDCYSSFANLIADNQYAALGLVLMGTLARTKRIIRPWGKMLERPAPSNNQTESERRNSVMELETLSPEQREEVHDLGEVVSRETLQQGDAIVRYAKMAETRQLDGGNDEGNDEDRIASPLVRKAKERGREAKDGKYTTVQESPAPTTSRRPKKKRKKGGDAFDDLFSGLI